MANWVKIKRKENKTNKKQSLAAISAHGTLMLAAFHEETCTELPAFVFNCLPAPCFCHMSRAL